MEEIKGKKKDSSEGKEGHDSTVNANPDKVLTKGDVMKKQTPPPFPQALHGKKGIINALEILEVLRQKAFLTEQVSAIIQCKSPLKYKDPVSYHFSHDWRKGSGESFVRLGSKCEFATILCLQAIGTWLEEERRILPLFNKERHKKLRLLLEVLKRCKKAIGWQISDLKGISPLVYTYHIYMEEEAKPIRQPQRRLNPHMQEVVRAEGCGSNEKGEEVATRLTSGPSFLLFLGRLLLVFSNRIDVEDQENTTFTCPFGTYAYRRMPFGLCNAPATFQRCMLSIFSDMVERIMEVFMDDITIYGSTFEECLVNLEAVLNRCIENDLVLNWEKCHFMVQQGIVLGHIISKRGIEVDKAKVELIFKLPSPTTVKGVRQFFGHVRFYRRFIKYFSKLSKPLCELLAKDAKFVWDERCQRSFEQLKQFLTNRSNSEGS
ncbi:Retrovirus-related Pol polyprotein from transposon 17.6 [Vitis vinifera]|uniref:Retrovirus-related Pol polyprotein from transposon 17.6 n=1 Tax=Vitis vinifera TaxID=29760 RepID=A0A438HJQ4_VITVI|nr:Retrovirus-related Pol polyprotein from transposon 17.6 [Vitis vinifera]